MKLDPTDPAFPAGSETGFHGLTKREAIAAIALHALLATDTQRLDINWSRQKTAVAAVQYADALLSELAE
jgi:hypothetical protein